MKLPRKWALFPVRARRVFTFAPGEKHFASIGSAAHEIFIGSGMKITCSPLPAGRLSCAALSLNYISDFQFSSQRISQPSSNYRTARAVKLTPTENNESAYERCSIYGKKRQRLGLGGAALVLLASEIPLAGRERSQHCGGATRFNYHTELVGVLWTLSSTWLLHSFQSVENFTWDWCIFKDLWVHFEQLTLQRLKVVEQSESFTTTFHSFAVFPRKKMCASLSPRPKHHNRKRVLLCSSTIHFCCHGRFCVQFADMSSVNGCWLALTSSSSCASAAFIFTAQANPIPTET